MKKQFSKEQLDYAKGAGEDFAKAERGITSPLAKQSQTNGTKMLKTLRKYFQ